MTTATTSTFVQPCLRWEGTCEAALEFFKTKLGAEVTMLMRSKDSPEPTPPPDKVTHASFPPDAALGGLRSPASRCPRTKKSFPNPNAPSPGCSKAGK